MEFDENNVTKEPEQVEIYSKTAIWCFSVFVSPLFGGILLMLNLRSAGYKRAANTVLIFSILYTIASEAIISFLWKEYKTGIYLLAITSIGLTITGAAILAEYFFKKYFPDDDYYPKSIATPLLVAILIAIPYMMLASRIHL